MTDSYVKYFECACSSSEHLVGVKLMKSIGDTDPPEVYISIHLADHQSFWKRLRAGLKYIFGYKSKYGNFDEIILTSTSATEMKELLELYVAQYNDWIGKLK